MRKVILFFSFLVLLEMDGFSQDKPRIYFSGIEGRTIKISQLYDTSIKIITSIDIHQKGTAVQVYFSGVGYPNVIATTLSIGSSLNSLKNKLSIGSQITIGGLATKDPKTNKNIYFEESWYKIVED